jgi:transcriptional regulator with XRE-family HTH domain
VAIRLRTAAVKLAITSPDLSSMPTRITKSQDGFARAMLRAAITSLVWVVFSERRKKNGLTFAALAEALQVNKSAISRWFNSSPNWTVNTIADLANALDVDIEIRARDRRSGAIYTPSGTLTTTHSGAVIFKIPVIVRAGFAEGISQVPSESRKPLLIETA